MDLVSPEVVKCRQHLKVLVSHTLAIINSSLSAPSTSSVFKEWPVTCSEKPKRCVSFVLALSVESKSCY